MYYVELIDRFWLFTERVKPGATVICLYLYLLKHSKENHTYQFIISDVELGKRLGFSRATIKTAKQKLKLWGLIEYKTFNGVPGNCRLIVNYPLDEVSSEQTKNDVPDVIRICNHSNNQLQIEKQDKLENADRISVVDEDSKSTELSEDKVKIPDVSEFLSYARTLDAYSPELDALITAKYLSWFENEWKSISGRLITNWRSSLKNVLPFLASEGKGSHLSTDRIPDIQHPKENP